MSYKYRIQSYDNWLEPWLARFNAPKGTALDVGCGPGLDTQVLSTRGFEVQACDVSADALLQSGGLNPTVPHAIADARELLPYPDSIFSVVVAGLSLHYFDQGGSVRAFGAVHRVLKPGGLFLFRLNAWDDFEFGAPRVHDAWQVVAEANGAIKQFFTEAMIRELAAGRFSIVSMEKKRSERYSRPKSFFECCAIKPDHAPAPGAGRRA